MLANPFKYRTCRISWQDTDVKLRAYRGDHITRALKRGHFYEDDFLQMIADKYSGPGLFVDVGAFVGNHAVFFAKYCQPDHVIAFEPFPETFSLLQHNVRLNNLEPTVTAINKAVSDKPGSMTMAIVNKKNRGMNRIDNGGDTSVEVATLDQELANNTMPIRFIKIDAEGYGWNVVAGAKSIIRQHQPVIAVELEPDMSDGSGSSGDIDSLLQELEYEPVSCHNGTPTWIYQHKSQI